MKSFRNYLPDLLRLVSLVAVCTVVLLTSAGNAYAQDTNSGGNVHGVVVDEAEHLPMPGVTVAVMKGSKMITGAATNLDGEFSVKVPDGAVLRFSYIGYAPQELAPVHGRSMEVVMKESAEKMQEVVVNGYFTRHRNTYTGAAKSLSGDELLSVSATNILSALSTLDAGLNSRRTMLWAPTLTLSLTS